MVEDVRLFDWILGGLLAALGVAFKWIFNDMKEDIRKIKDQGSDTAVGLADFRLHVSEYYPKEKTMERIYKTMEDMAKDVNDLKVMFAKKSH